MAAILLGVFAVFCFACAGAWVAIYFYDRNSGAWFNGFDAVVWAPIAVLVSLGLLALRHANRLERTEREAALGRGPGTTGETKNDGEKKDEEI